MTTTPVLSVRGLSVGYRVSRELREVLHDISFDVAPGQVLALVGESGSGKTTTGHAILGLLPGNGELTAGSITFRGEELTTFTGKQWRDLRGRTVSLIPQDPTVSLDPVRAWGIRSRTCCACTPTSTPPHDVSGYTNCSSSSVSPRWHAATSSTRTNCPAHAPTCAHRGSGGR